MPSPSWDAEEEEPVDTRTSTGNSDMTDDSLPELGSDDTEEDKDGFTFLNTPGKTVLGLISNQSVNLGITFADHTLDVVL